MAQTADIEALRRAWTELYSKILPNLGLARDPAQSKWPVTLDHCFARIILDNTVGEGREQWDKRLKRPAIRNMSQEQLKSAIKMAERIRDGKDDLVALDLQSLEIRGKSEKKYKSKLSTYSATDQEKSKGDLACDGSTWKTKRPEPDDRDITCHYFKKAKTSGKQTTLSFVPSLGHSGSLPSPPVLGDEKVDLSPTLHRIYSNPALTSYRKRLYAALLSVPRGRYTTYAALSQYLKSSARAVGNGMRNNPFAPEVPCHRVLASDGSVGGFGGSWGVDGMNASKKLDLLKKEGVNFDSSGKVRGPLFKDFVDLSDGG